MDNENVQASTAEKAAEATISESRRAFIKTAAQVAMTSPAVNILLAASTKMAAAQQIIYPCAGGQRCDGFHILDDFTFGNNEEDLDAINLGSNFNNWNGTNNQDDVFIP